MFTFDDLVDSEDSGSFLIIMVIPDNQVELSVQFTVMVIWQMGYGLTGSTWPFT